MNSQIAIDLRMYRMSGIGRYLQLLMPGVIPRLNASRIRILGDPGEFSGENWMGDPRIELCEFRAPIFSVAEQLAGLYGYREDDLLWVPQYNIPLIYGGKLLVTIHDVCQLAHPEVLQSDLQRRYSRLLLSAVAKHATGVLCVSEFTLKEVEAYLGIEKSRLFVTYPGLSNLHQESVSLRPIHDDVPYLLAVGNI